ncbi:hypothetical protein [Delftia sp. DT-2]|uniref:hypothetical protein n=1 Tax=Delftia sp. DT-2 TaxID=3022772 RepID=UPI00233F6ACA|nr:hypothetical protein [Delftia sp. DT-2]MDC2861299.1 hypothetical protein [Delftia sp. DT-2]
MRTCTCSGLPGCASPPRSSHTGRLKLFHTRLPRVCQASAPSTYTATVPTVCQRGMYRRAPCGVGARASGGTTARNQRTSGGARARSPLPDTALSPP